MFDEEELNEIERERVIDYDSDDEYGLIDNNYEARARPINAFTAPQIQYAALEEPINLTNIFAFGSNDVDREGFKKNKNKKRLKNEFRHEITKSETMSCEEARIVRNVNLLPSNQRWNLYRLWVKLYVEKLVEEIKINRDLYRNECLRFNGIRNQEDIEVVKGAKIIGMTTTGAAKFHHIIAGVKPRITSKAF